MKKNILIITGIALATLAIAGFLYWKQVQVANKEAAPTTETVAENTTKALEAITETPEINASQNPLQDKVPELNPVEKINPFNVYENPFQ